MESKPFQKLTEATRVYIFDGGVQGYVELADGTKITFSSHTPTSVTAFSRLDLCFNSDVPRKYRDIAAKTLAAYRANGTTGEFEETL